MNLPVKVVVEELRRGRQKNLSDVEEEEEGKKQGAKRGRPKGAKNIQPSKKDLKAENLKLKLIKKVQQSNNSSGNSLSTLIHLYSKCRPDIQCNFWLR